MHMEEYQNKPDLEDICQVEKDLISALRSVVAHGLFSKEVDGKELGALTDMIKDMAETKKNCWEAKYYETVCQAMEEYDEDEDNMGYNSNRYKNGKYAPSGTGNRMTSRPSMKPDYSTYQNGRDSVMGFSDGKEDWMPSSMNSRFQDYRGLEGRKYEPYGEAYHEYEDARRHYTESKSMEDKTHMDKKAREHVDNSIMTLKEIWKNADPTLRKEMKSSLTSLVSEMPV